MRWNLAFIVVTLMVTGAAAIPLIAQATVAHGQVITTRSGCDYFVVETPSGLSVMEWYGGWTPDRGDTVSGVLEEYGFHSIYDASSRQSIRVYIDDYGLDEDDASDKLNDDCG